MYRMKEFALIAQLILLAGAACGVPCPSYSSPYLVSSGDSSTIYQFSEYIVTLVCRPASNATCQWTLDGLEIDTGCTLYFHDTGTLRCVNGEDVFGIINVRRPRDQYISFDNGESDYYNNGYGHYQLRRIGALPPPVFLCRRSGSIVDELWRCDGKVDCGGGEDEHGCSFEASCSAPGVSHYSRLVGDQQKAYAHNTSVAYVCEPGYAFNDTVGSKTRTCKNGRWYPARPFICHKNLAALRPVWGEGAAIPGLERSKVVDEDPNTWSILQPGQSEQSMKVSLTPGTAPSHVVVKTTNVQFRVLLEYNGTEGTGRACRCKVKDDVSASTDNSRIAVCDCSKVQLQKPADGDANTTFPVNIIIRSDETLVVAEVIAINSTSNLTDFCQLFDTPAHGKLKYGGTGREVAVTCDPGYMPSCNDDWVSCGADEFDLRCVPVDCGPPPTIARADIVASQNGTSWRATVQYACQSGYAVFPTDQPTTAVCGSDGLWSFGHLNCVADTDIRVVTSSLTQQFQRSVDTLQLEVETLRQGQLQLLQRLQRTQQQLDATQQQLRQLLTDEPRRVEIDTPTLPSGDGEYGDTLNQNSVD